MMLHIVVHTKMYLFENKTLSPFGVIFLLCHPRFCNVQYMFTVYAKTYHYFMNVLLLYVCMLFFLCTYMPPSYCNRFAQRASRQCLCKHGYYTTIRKAVFSVLCRVAACSLLCNAEVNTLPIARQRATNKFRQQ
jgi:hypothetical protein